MWNLVRPQYLIEYHRQVQCLFVYVYDFVCECVIVCVCVYLCDLLYWMTPWQCMIGKIFMCVYVYECVFVCVCVSMCVYVCVFVYMCKGSCHDLIQFQAHEKLSFSTSPHHFISSILILYLQNLFLSKSNHFLIYTIS